MTEFALSLPFLLTAGLWGVETAYLTMVHMRVSQLAIHIADNASRTGDTSTLEDRKIYESDVTDLLIGANIQAGEALDFFQHGRAFVSSVEVWDQSVHCNPSSGCGSNPQSDGVQFIHWQRCAGAKRVNSSYGTQNAALPNGIGPAGNEVQAEPGSPVMFVEVQYDYQPLFSARFVGATTISATSAFMVRDSRDESGIKQRNESNPDPIADCNNYATLG